MSHIEREIIIDRPVEEVFDFLADVHNEPQYRMNCSAQFVERKEQTDET